MVEMRSNCFVLIGLVLIFLSLTASLACAHKAKEEVVIVVVKGEHAFLAAGGPEKENFDVVRNAAGANSGKLGGRKMMEKVVMGKEKPEEAVEEVSPKNSGANCFVGNCKSGGRSSSTQPVKGKREEFMTFNADYDEPSEEPRTHLPKNN